MLSTNESLHQTIIMMVERRITIVFDSEKFYDQIYKILIIWHFQGVQY